MKTVGIHPNSNRRGFPMTQVALSLPTEVVSLIERQARMRFRDRAEHIRELVLGALLANGSLKATDDVRDGK